ncbi:alpha/beta fold hydrolase, partial [Nocardia farcinica]|uniref:alpha/beta fold hydrolase n=1 Tax=Nocardia farcinica TaxID=37329 RepID=UPI002454342E
MKTVAGPTDRVVVIGAGLAGLAAALYLTGAGRQVTLLERADHPGGRVGRYRGPDYEIDSGATVLTLPEVVADLAELLRAETDGPVLVAGHSFGGATGVHLAARHPDLVRA